MPLQIHTGYGHPDLDLLGATLFRRALDRVLDDLLGTADLTADDAAHVRWSGARTRSGSTGSECVGVSTHTSPRLPLRPH